LRPYARDEEEADKQQDRERPEFADQQVTSGMELLTKENTMAKKIKVKGGMCKDCNKPKMQCGCK
jgi:hypothetical protein